MIRRLGCRGQSVMEYAITIALMVAALLAAQRFMKSSLMGRWRAIADSFGYGRLYENGKSTVTPP